MTDAVLPQIDHENFLSFGVGLALLTLGAVGTLGADDVLACFVAGNSLTWKDFYRIENEDETFQDVIDNLLNTAIFIYLGALMPWSSFGDDHEIGLSPWRLVVLGLLVLLVRRVPWVMALYKWIPSLGNAKEAAFAGYFGPIGVSGIYYAILATEKLPEEREHLIATIYPVVMFLALTSTVAHGITIPVARFTPHLLKRTRSSVSVASDGATVFFRSLRGDGASGMKPRRGFRTEDISGPLPNGSSPSTGASTPLATEGDRTPSNRELDVGLARMEGGQAVGPGEVAMAEVGKGEPEARTAEVRFE